MSSELWASLLRGGVVKTGLVRSLSGWHTAAPLASPGRQLLQDIVDGADGGRAFWEACRQPRGNRRELGGDLINTAVRAVFAAILHHSPGLRVGTDTSEVTPTQSQPWPAGCRGAMTVG